MNSMNIERRLVIDIAIKKLYLELLKVENPLEFNDQDLELMMVLIRHKAIQEPLEKAFAKEKK